MQQAEVLKINVKITRGSLFLVLKMTRFFGKGFIPKKSQSLLMISLERIFFLLKNSRFMHKRFPISKREKKEMLKKLEGLNISVVS
jgi:hypothetical protein